MTPLFRIIVALICLISIAIMVREINKRKLKIHYVLFWAWLSLILILLVIFPDILKWTAHILGVRTQTNLLFAFLIFVLLVKAFTQTLQIAALETKVERLAQSLALKEKHVQEGENTKALPDDQTEEGR